MLDKKALYEKHHKELSEAVTVLSDYLKTYEDSRQRSCALTKVEEAYLWATQMIHMAILEEELKEVKEKIDEEKEKEDKPPVDLSIN